MALATCCCVFAIAPSARRQSAAPHPRRQPGAAAPTRRAACRARRSVVAAATDTVIREGLTMEDFNALLESQPATLVDFYTSWCGPCKVLALGMNKIEPEYVGKCSFEKIDCEKNYAVAQHFAVKALPTIILFKGTEQLDRKQGVMTAQDLDLWLKSKLK